MAARVASGELRELVSAGPVELPAFLAATGRELADVYTGKFGWRAVQVQAGVLSPDKEARRARRVAHATVDAAPGRTFLARLVSCKRCRRVAWFSRITEQRAYDDVVWKNDSFVRDVVRAPGRPGDRVVACVG